MERVAICCCGGAGLCCCAPCGGCQLQGRRRKKNGWELPQCFPRYEIVALFQSVPLTIKEEKRVKSKGKGRPDSGPDSGQAPSRKTALHNVSLLADRVGTTGLNGTCGFTLGASLFLPCVRTYVCVRVCVCVCLRVFEGVPETREEGG